MQQNLGHVLNGRPAAIDTEPGAVNIGRVVAGQKHDCGGDLGWSAHSPRRDAGQNRSDVIGELLLSFRCDRSRCDALTRTPNRPYSASHDWVKESIAALLAL